MMKQTLLTAAAACLVAISLSTPDAWAQAPGKPQASDQAHKVGLIDMAHVFKEYKKFADLREGLKTEIMQSDDQAKAIAQKAENLKNEMAQLKPGSDDFLSREKQLAKLTSDFETFRKVAQRDFLRKEAKLYHEIYQEVTDAVALYADYYKYTLVIRFNREELESGDPQKLIQGMNRQVVWHRPDDDITLSVLDYLNRNYEKTAGRPAATPTR